MAESTRRDFLKRAGYGGLALTLFRNQTIAQNREEIGIVVVEKIPKEDIRHLDDFLREENKPLFNPGNTTIELRTEHWPQVAYSINLEKSSDGVDVARLNSAGHVFVFGEGGFFLTAHHVFENYLAGMKQGKNSLMLVYDPATGLTTTARPLAYAKNNDILIGRIDSPNAFNTQRVHLGAHPPPLDYVYTPTYENIEFLTGGLFRQVINSLNMQYTDRDGRVVLAFKPIKLAEDGKELDKHVRLGKLTDLVDEMEKKLRRIDGEYAFMGQVVHGHSGSPVLDLQNRLVGVIKSSEKIYDTNAQKEINLGIYTGSSKIRDMILKYLAAHK